MKTNEFQNTSKPLEGATVELLDEDYNIVARGTTDKDGLADLEGRMRQ